MSWAIPSASSSHVRVWAVPDGEAARSTVGPVTVAASHAPPPTVEYWSSTAATSSDSSSKSVYSTANVGPNTAGSPATGAGVVSTG